MFRTRISGLALVSVGLVTAAIIGVQLGRSAISEINPIHFEGPLERPRAITPPPEPAPIDPYGQPYVWSTSPPALADCAPYCGDGQARQAMRLAMDEPAGRDTSLPYWRDATPTTELRPWAPGTTPDRSRIERYLHYPVSGEEVAPVTPAPPETNVVASRPAAEALRPPPVPVMED
jgi:hypothetical protein